MMIAMARSTLMVSTLDLLHESVSMCQFVLYSIPAMSRLHCATLPPATWHTFLLFMQEV